MNDTDQRPIGYWLKHLDGLIERALDGALARQELSRRHWQVLNTLRSAPTDRIGLTEALRPFLADAGTTTVHTALDELIDRGWVRGADDGRFELTAAGRAGHAEAQQQVTATRRRLLDAVTPEEYQAVVDGLRRMARSLEDSAA